MSVIDIEQAKKEMESWLEYKKISPAKRETNAQSIEAIATAISDGTLRLDDNFNLIQTLKFPIGDEMVLKELTYKPRINVGLVRKAMEKVKATEADNRIAVYISVLTSQTLGTIDKLDSEDQSIAQSIAIFFL